jgi:two-component system sensor histidine kinase BaeS
MKKIREHISIKLFLSYLIVLFVGVSVLLIAVLLISPGAYSRHMDATTGTGMSEMMNSSGTGLGRGQQFQGAGFLNFRAGVLEAMGYSMVAAVLVAVTVSIILSRQIIAPLKAMMGVSQRIADGHYDERVDVYGSDELAQLAQRFNKMAERLEQTETMRRQLIGDVSHELRTPLTVIGGYMEGLMDGVLPASGETYEQVRVEANRLSRLVDDLQELSRVEAGSYRLDIKPATVSGIITTTAKRLVHHYAAKNVNLKFGEGLDELPMVMADGDRIVQVLMNLLGNALVYTPAEGTVTIVAQKISADVQISIHDTGIGISAENLPFVFDRFYRVDKSRSRGNGGGSGIGLTIAKAIVEAHGGRIWVESLPEKPGSTFTFTLPVVS